MARSQTPQHYALMETPFGWIAIVGGESGLRRITLPHEDSNAAREAVLQQDQQATESTAAFAGLVGRLQRYFAGEAVEFPDALDLSNTTPFQQAVYAELQAVPYGTTATYAEIARRVGRPNAPRAVGRVNATNPWPIVMPCHRLVGSDGALHGYAGGLDMKRALLELEGGNRASKT